MPKLISLPIDDKLIDDALELLDLRETIKKDESQLPDTSTLKSLVGSNCVY
jgi:hypothetical protein